VGLPGLLFLLALAGCGATQGGPREQSLGVAQSVGLLGRVVNIGSRLADRVDDLEARVGRLEAGAVYARGQWGDLRLERQVVLDATQGALFAPGDAGLTPTAQRAIEQLLKPVKGREDVVFLVTGQTDGTGAEGDNYALGWRRAVNVTGYLTRHQGIAPLRVVTMSYGASVPVASNVTPEGRRRNRRVELLAYLEVLTAAPGQPVTAQGLNSP
jgi:outer membrane protein OmpA-like peptidoglycan-associated protein